jgi:hypothetical protein
MLVETIGEAVFWNAFVNGLQRGVSRLKAQHEWVPQNFVRASRPYQSSLRSLKHLFEHGTRYYLHEDEMARAFRANGIRVVGGRVYAKQRHPA